MNLTDYQAFCKTTAIYPPEHKIVYPALGLISEVGELCGKYKKILRDKGGVISDADREAMLDECGDVLWYCAALATDCGFDLDSPLGDYTSGKTFRYFLALGKSAAKAAYSAPRKHTGGDTFEHVFDTLTVLAGVTWELGELTLEQLADRNAAKLTARKAKGTLSGSGDER